MNEDNQNIIQKNSPSHQEGPNSHSDDERESLSHRHSLHTSSPSHSSSQIEKDQYSHKGKQEERPRAIRYKYCCKICKHTDKNKKACVCVVPLTQRRAAIGQNGCQTCSCNGCSKEDFISRGEDPEFKPEQKYTKRGRQKQQTFEARNGCCRKCMKAFSKSNKSCLCQVPEDVRNTKLPCTGCKICGCFGCNPEDKKDPKNRKTSKRQRSRSRSKKRKQKKSRKRSQSSNSRQYIDTNAMNFYNVDRSVIGSMVLNEYRVDPALLGFGIPQRSQSYIIGRPK